MLYQFANILIIPEKAYRFPVLFKQSTEVCHTIGNYSKAIGDCNVRTALAVR